LRELQSGQRIRTKPGGELEIIEELGRGGQGIVYRVSYGERQLALKWYFPMEETKADDMYNNIQNIIKSGAPTDAFLWPMEITEKKEVISKDGKKKLCFGYLMELRPPEYKDFSRFLLAKEKFSGIEAVVNAALGITSGFRILHIRGYSYQDLNDGNFFVDPKTGDVLICDNDNVAEYGFSFGIAGKCRYMAPEIVMGKTQPGPHTDRFSLAVVLYMLLFLNHPLEGKKTMCPCLTEELEKRFYGSDPVFVWDPEDDSNRPVRGVHINEIRLWPLYPEFIHEAFEEAFSREAMIGENSTHRVDERKWQYTFTMLRDIIVTCSCGNETFIDVARPSCRCINCGREIQRPPVLKVKKYQVALAPGRKIYACHVLSDSDDFREVKGEAVRSRSNPPVLGLKNESGLTWEVTLPDGTGRTCEDGQVTRLVRGMKISFAEENVGEII